VDAGGEIGDGTGTFVGVLLHAASSAADANSDTRRGRVSDLGMR